MWRKEYVLVPTKNRRGIALAEVLSRNGSTLRVRRWRSDVAVVARRWEEPSQLPASMVVGEPQADDVRFAQIEATGGKK